MANVRQTTPGHFWFGEEEEKTLTFNVGNWFTAPTGASTVVKAGGSSNNASDVSASVLSGATTISGSLITTPCFTNITSGCDYRAEIKIQQGGEILEAYFFITGAS